MRKYIVSNYEQVAEWPEIAMALHLAEAEDDNNVYALVGCRLAVRLDELLSPEASPDPLPPVDQMDEWLSSDDLRRRRFRELPPEGIARALYYAVSVSGPWPPMPPRPPSIYGHLPFTSTTTGFDRFYRWEPWPSSRKFVSTTTGAKIVGETFAAPESELPLVPSGFAAVARYALPNLWPSTSRHLIEPDQGQTFYCGPSVPLYGMSGGGVEVKFDAGTTLRRMPPITVINAL